MCVLQSRDEYADVEIAGDGIVAIPTHFQLNCSAEIQRKRGYWDNINLNSLYCIHNPQLVQLTDTWQHFVGLFLINLQC